MDDVPALWHALQTQVTKLNQMYTEQDSTSGEGGPLLHLMTLRCVFYPFAVCGNIDFFFIIIFFFKKKRVFSVILSSQDPFK